MKKLELIFTPFPLLTHLNPAIELAKRLINRDDDLFITFLIMKMPFDAKAQSYSQSISRESTNSSLRFVHLREPSFSSETFSPIQYFSEVIDRQKILVKNAVDDIIAETKPTRVAGFFIDMFCSAMIDVANDFGVPTYSFYIGGAGTLGTFHFHSLIEDSNQETIDYSDSTSDFEISIPTYTNPVPVKLLPSSFFNKAGVSVLLNHARRLRETKGILISTFQGLESNAINALLNDKNLPPIYPVGPVINLEGISSQNPGSESIMKWLDDQPDSSVVFLCFGSGGSFKAGQLKEIAYALEQSGHRFLWALRWPPANSPMDVAGETKNFEEVLPEGFLKRTEGIGLVMAWVPQMQVLSHSSVGGFVTHCGWSSTMEALYCGVPMAAWPLHSDQQMTAFFLVKELGIAVDIKMDYRWDNAHTDPEIVKADKIENGIRQLMDPKTGIREKAKEMKEKARMSILKGGSSYISMGNVIKEIYHHVD